jgi:hypothetical protein
VTPSFFKVAPIGAIRGRVFDAGDGEVGKNQKVLLSHGFWQRRMGGRDDAIGKQLRLNGQQFEVVGVLPKEFTFLQNDIDLFTPAAFAPATKATIAGTATTGR